VGPGPRGPFGATGQSLDRCSKTAVKGTPRLCYRGVKLCVLWLVGDGGLEPPTSRTRLSQADDPRGGVGAGDCGLGGDVE
jgi:hypothetical protein